MGIVPQALPLHAESPLNETEKTEIIGHRWRCIAQSQWLTLSQPERPLGPGLTMAHLKRHEESISLQPMGFLLAKALELAPAGAGRSIQKPLPSLPQTRHSVRYHAFKIAVTQVKHGSHLWRQPPQAHQLVQIHQHGVARKGRGAVVRRIAWPNGRERQDLPEALPGRHEPINKVIGLCTQVTRAMGAGERGDMQQDAAGALQKNGGICIIHELGRQAPTSSHSGAGPARPLKARRP